MLTLIKGGRVVDPGNLDGIMDILIEDGKIVEIKKQRSEVRSQKSELARRQSGGVRIIDASGKIVTPGLMDMHVHFREPGHEYKETIKT
ncbi:MAG: dihydroorotase, partial [Desulfobacterales bacterium]|nr:dihydroorotase [Desulfobacterales bacterium]